MNKKCLVITTINDLANTYISNYFKYDFDIIIVGDKKTNHTCYTDNTQLIYLHPDTTLYQNLGKILPFNHYCRKNIGYLYAINNNYDIIFDTDDDNLPLNNFQIFRDNEFSIIESPKFPNIYKLYTPIHMWARGFPLELIRNNEKIEYKSCKNENVGIYQSIVDGDPDVDAIYRLTNQSYNNEITFKPNQNFIINKDVYVSGNTQATFWVSKELFYLLYIPSTVSFRCCDIYKIYIAQRCMWEYNKLFCYISPIVKQIRNQHDYLKDFKSEIGIYTNILMVVNDVLDKIKLKGNKYDIMLIYEQLLVKNIVKEEEIDRLTEWLNLIP